ncbi:hypothetical protein DJ568_10410 [Mucilaginibacter hurinus]|uniref:histidine kinase n=1 Tax=Mucilaginibacter hurinus TaxID=2201324 RepID=A0A367GQ99_9SPHI|nr:ATP-binding protein [Mucilaginibacter hurinus]RCH54883.1 hypothetical protein DJ568_10410 [Mucilaginibacter hurinus]
MKAQLPFFNFSLRKVLALEPDSFKKAKIKIVLIILLFSTAKLFIALPFAIEHQQYLQITRTLAIVFIFLFLIKVVLYRPSATAAIAHAMIICGLVMIWTNLFIYVQHINIFTIQLIFMTSLVSYYLIGGSRAGWYTFMAMSPLMVFILTKESIWGHFKLVAQELPSPGMDIIILLNFLTFIFVHYVYYDAFTQNLKEKQALNDQLELNVKEAKALAESRSVFLSTMSHELRTPLNGVIGMTNLIKDTAVEEQKDYLNVLEFSATNLLSVINDILDYNKIELDKIQLETVPVSLPALLHQICTGLGIKAAEKALAWKLEVDPKLKDCLVITDPTRLTQIIYNLAGNAIKFTSDGMVGVSVKVVTATNNTVLTRFTVTDTGIGIDISRQEAIFDIFTQASSDTTRKYGGTGLGLAIVKKLLKLFNSNIHLKSEAGKGSEFSFEIDFQLSHDEINISSDFTIVKKSMKGLKLLIAEDNNINIMLLEKLLAKWDVHTEVVLNGREAVNRLASDNFDGVLMDLHMPVMDGYEATAAIRALNNPAKAQTPIIAITASVSGNIHSKIREVGMQDFLSKPFQADQLYEKLQQIYKPVKL